MQFNTIKCNTMLYIYIFLLQRRILNSRAEYVDYLLDSRTGYILFGFPTREQDGEFKRLVTHTRLLKV